MPHSFGTEAFERAASQAFNGYQPNTPSGGNVRSGAFIRYFQDACRAELQSRGLPPAPISSNNKVVQSFSFETERSMLGGHYVKNIDLTLQSSSSGPLLSISLKSMLSSVAKNVNNRWEEAIGDAANMHARFPMLVLGFVMILPSTSYATSGSKTTPEPILDGNGNPTALAESIVKKLSAARGRSASTELPSYYEEVAVAVINYPQQPHTLNATFPPADSPLRIEGFFDRLVARYRERNPSIL